MENKEVETSKNLILKCFSFLKDQGYAVKVEGNDSELFLESLNVVFTNEIKKRKIIISFTKSKFDEEIRFTFSATVVRIPYNDPYEDFFSLSAYGNETGNKFNRAIINRFEESEAESIVMKISEFLQKNASVFVDGTAWEKGYYPKWN